MSIRDIIFEDFETDSIAPSHLDELLANGWRHAGVHFYRYNFAFHEGTLTEVLPLRITLERFSRSKSQRRLMKRNQDEYQHVIRPTTIDVVKERMFQEHKRKFVDNVPESIYDFLSRKPDQVPCEGCELAVYDGKRLIAVSFFDVGHQCISSIYGMYDLAYSDRGLGIYTMLLEIAHAQSLGKTYYYHGYCYRCPSFYDYKKRFNGLEYFDWRDEWHPWESSEDDAGD